MEQLSRATPFFLSEAQKSHLFFCAERALFERYPLVDAGEGRSICKHTIPFWVCFPCASFPIVIFFRW